MFHFPSPHFRQNSVLRLSLIAIEFLLGIVLQFIIELLLLTILVLNTRAMECLHASINRKPCAAATR